MTKTVFLDRDGTLNREQGFVRNTGELDVLPGVPEALQRLAAAGYRLVVLTNQSGIARGLYGERDLSRVHERLHELLGALPSAYLHCPHHADMSGAYGGACTCRKPATGLIDQADRLFDVDWARSFLIGDSARDLLVGRERPLRKILVRSGKPTEEQLALLLAEGLEPCHVAVDLPAAVHWLLAAAN